MPWQRANSPGSSCLVFILIFTTSCSSATPVRDAGVESDVEIEYNVASYGELFIDETDNPQLQDTVFSSFHTRFEHEIREQCGFLVEEVPLDECRFVPTPSQRHPPGDCDNSCSICGFTEDCSGARCITGNTDLLMEAGDVVITGGTRPRTCEEDPGTFHYYCHVESASSIEPGDTLEITASGGSFPGFELTTTVLPRPELITDTDSWTVGFLDGTNDVRVEWVPSGGSRMEIILSNRIGDEYLLCSADDDGQFDIPADHIAELNNSPFVSEFRLVMTRVNETTIRPTPESMFTARLVSYIGRDVTRR